MNMNNLIFAKNSYDDAMKHTGYKHIVNTAKSISKYICSDQIFVEVCIR